MGVILEHHGWANSWPIPQVPEKEGLTFNGVSRNIWGVNTCFMKLLHLIHSFPYL